jgi:polyhydroxyalkanoate synthesis repressor PhaR
LKLLKKYPNRRIYDTSCSRFITIADVRRLVLDYEPFRVVDSRTGADLTRATLLQVITEMEAEGRESLLTDRVLEELIRFYGNSVNRLLRGHLEQAICALLAQQNLLRGSVKQVIDNSNPVPLMTEMARHYSEFWRRMLSSENSTSKDKAGD